MTLEQNESAYQDGRARVRDQRFLLPAGKAHSEEELERQLGIDMENDLKEDRRQTLFMLIGLGFFLLGVIAAAVVVGLSYHHWKHLLD